MPQIPPLLAFGVLSCVALGVAVLSAVWMYLSRSELHAVKQRAHAAREKQDSAWQAALDALSQRVDLLAAEMRDFGDHAAVARPATKAATVRSGMNLTKRAQALRMHRRGDPPEQIAALLDVPSQEVNLLLKVHRIVMSSI